MPKITAIYVRVSHRDQSHASQLPDLERWAEAHDGSVEWFRDTFSGRTMDRPGMDRLLMNCEPVGSVASWSGVWTAWAGPPEGSANSLRNSKRRRSIWSRSRTGSPWHHQPVGSMPASWRASPSTRPRSGLSVFTPVSRLPGARERPGAVGERLAVAGHRRAGDGDPGDEGGEDADRQDRPDHRAVRRPTIYRVLSQKI